MFALLPETLKEQVTRYLATDNFVAAKALRDAWLAQQKNCNQTIADAG